MHISITGPAEINTNVFHDSVVGHLTRTLARFSHRIARVDIALTDQNGPRGGIDKHCRISVRMPGFEPFATAAKNGNRRAAVADAARKARRKVTIKLKRPRSVRERFRRNRWQTSDSPAV